VLYLAIAVVLIAVLVFTDRVARRALEQCRAAELERVGADGAHAALLERLLAAHRDQVGVLCQRIQAPLAAVAEHHAAVSPEEKPNPLPMTDAEMAEAGERERLIKWMEDKENGGGPAAEVTFP
jgi:hypothetical protein